jgi:sigma-B regulation protein RsbU (phosphoserine phosphatase)
MLSDAWRTRLIALYSLGVGVAGWYVLAVATDGSVLRANLPVLLTFAALSVVVKRFGLHVARDAVPSLVGIVDLAAVFAFGPALGAWVAAVSGLTYLLLRAVRRHLISWRFLWEEAWFSSGLKALIAFTCGYLYLRQGGAVAPTILTWPMSLRLVGTVALWFALDRFAWGFRTWLRAGWPGLIEFLQKTWAYSLPVELLPLPLSIVIALAYVGMGVPVFALLALALVATGALLQRLTETWSRLEQRLAEANVLNEFGRALVEAQLDVEQLCELVYTYCQRVVSVPVFLLELVREDHQSTDEKQVDVVILVEQGERLPPRKLPLTGTVRWMADRREPFLCNDLHKEGLPFEPYVTGTPSRASGAGTPLPKRWQDCASRHGLGGVGDLPQSLLVIPLLAGPRLMGVLSAQSDETNAFTQEQLKVLSALANQAAMAIANAQVYLAEQRRAKQLTAIGQVSQRVVSILDLDRLFVDVVGLIQKTFGYDHVAVFTLDPDTHAVTFRAGSNPELQQQGLQIGVGEGIVGWVAQLGEAIVANDVSKEARFRWDAVLGDTKAELAAPLKVEDRIVGVLDVQSNEVGAFGKDDLFVIQTLAHQVAIAVEDARLYADRQEEAWVSTALLQAADAVRSLDSLDDILETAVRITPMLVGVDRCSILLRDLQVEEFSYARGYSAASDLKPLFRSGRMRTGRVPLLDQLLAGKVPVVVDKAPTGALPRASGGRRFMPARLAKELGTRTLFALPLYAQAEVYGIMLVDYAATSTRLSERRQTILRGIADQVAMAVANARLHNAQREEAWVSTALLQVAQAFVSSTALDENLAKIARLTTLLVGVDGCMIFLTNTDRTELEPYASQGLSKELVDVFHSLRLRAQEVPLLERMMQSQGLIALEKATDSDLLPASLLYTFDIQAVLAAPLVSKGELLGALLVYHTQGPRRFSERRETIVEGIAHQCAIAIENAHLYEATLEQERVAQELRVAREIQASFLPQECPALPGWELCADWHGARGVSGDFYDFIPLDEEHIGLVVADVSDKGVPAALFMSLSRTLVRVCAAETLSPAKTLQRVNELMVAQTHSDMFLTLFYGVLNWHTGELSYANGGHNPPILWRYGPQAQVTTLTAKGVILGVLEQIALEERRVCLKPGDILILYTDGVTEPINEQEQEFGEERLVTVISSNSEKPCHQLVKSIHTAVFEFAGHQPQFDDYTLIGVKRSRLEVSAQSRTSGDGESSPRLSNGETLQLRER